MSERGLGINHTTIFRWLKRNSSDIGKRVRSYLRSTNDSWRLGETYLKLHGEQVYLYRIVDSSGDTVDFLLSQTRDKHAAIRLLRKALASRHNQMPHMINTYKYPATEVATAEEVYMGCLDSSVHHRMCKYPNNIVEQYHWFIKRRTGPMLGFLSWRSAYSTLIGIETMNMLRKQQAESMTPKQEVVFIHWVMTVA